MRWGRLAALGALVVLTIFFVPQIGSRGVTLDEVLWQLRAPRLCLALLAGLGLSLAGAVFQAIFRNPLATPFTLGVSSGASLFVAIGVLLVPATSYSASIKTGFAMAGSLATIGVVYGLAFRRRRSDSATLLLAGVAIAFLSMAGIVIVQALAHEAAAQEIIRWMMGSVEAVGASAWRAMVPCALILGVCCYAIARAHRALDLLMMSEVVALSRGVDIQRTRTLAYFAASAMTAAIVALCGPIAFVGLLVPHTMRFLFGPRHAGLLPACALGGMVFLPWCDVLAYNMLPWLSQLGLVSQNLRPLPVGVFTSLIGGLFFLLLLFRTGRSRQLV